MPIPAHFSGEPNMHRVDETLSRQFIPKLGMQP